MSQKEAVDEISNTTDDRNRVDFVMVVGAYISQRHFGETSMEAAKRLCGIDILINNGKPTPSPINVNDNYVKTKSNLQQTPYSVMEDMILLIPKKS